MPEYLAPGVYIEEVDIGAKPIEGVSTSTAGFLGETLDPVVHSSYESENGFHVMSIPFCSIPFKVFSCVSHTSSVRQRRRR